MLLLHQYFQSRTYLPYFSFLTPYSYKGSNFFQKKMYTNQSYTYSILSDK